MNIEEDIKEVLTNLSRSWKDDIINTKKEDLDRFWYYRYDDTLSKEWNLYQFSSSLESFKRTCRTWEEHHNGHMCVVERVRDQYLMPKIKQFMKDLDDGN